MKMVNRYMNVYMKWEVKMWKLEVRILIGEKYGYKTGKYEAQFFVAFILPFFTF